MRDVLVAPSRARVVVILAVGFAAISLSLAFRGASVNIAWSGLHQPAASALPTAAPSLPGPALPAAPAIAPQKATAVPESPVRRDLSSATPAKRVVPTSAPAQRVPP